LFKSIIVRGFCKSKYYKINMSKNLISTVLNFIKRKKYDDAINLLENFSKINENSNFVHRMLGLVYLNKKQWEKLIYVFT